MMHKGAHVKISEEVANRAGAAFARQAREIAGRTGSVVGRQPDGRVRVQLDSGPTVALKPEYVLSL